jgi:hypothetical protein
MTWPIVFSSLIGCSFILEEAVKPESAKDSLRYPFHPSVGRDGHLNARFYWVSEGVLVR